jgi:CBS domain-containing protein
LKIHQEYEADVLHHTTVSETMERNAPIISAATPVSELADRIARGDAEVSRHQGVIVVDSEGKLAGLITRGDLLRALEQDPAMTVLDAGTCNVVVTFPDEALHDASEKMLRYNIGRLPVVDRADQRHVVGYLGRPGILAARLRKYEEEYVREPGWFRGFRKTS